MQKSTSCLSFPKVSVAGAIKMNHTSYLDTSILERAEGILRSNSSLFLYLVVPVSTISLWTIGSYFSSPLKKYPGPFLASK